MATSDLRSWAVKGAEQRLVEIADETRAIYRAFPELRGRNHAGGSSQVRDGVNHNQAGPPKRRRRKMSRAARKKISDAQKARWAKQRAKK